MLIYKAVESVLAVGNNVALRFKERLICTIIIQIPDAF